VTKADQLFTAKQYEPALTEYTAALAIKAGEQYPKDRIAEIQGILAELKATEDAYRASVKNADQFFAEKKYVEARVEYQNAGAVKPLEQYPKDRISEISRILTEMQGKKVTYDNLLQSAGDLLGVKEYNKSKELYQQASGIFPEEAFPKERIAWITRTVDSIYRANKGQYDIAVANGDKYYTAFEFDKAIDSYTEAIGYLPMEPYPKEQIAKIRRTIAENAIVDVLRTPVTIAAGDEKRFSFEPVNIAARKDNFVYLKIRNLSDKTFNILMRYGRDAQSNGGVVIRNISTDGKVNERLISVRDQDLWYRADNNWISLFPQGGDIEVSFIQVSKVR
jgi:tetratricopeptide (TPR) repeat protein